MSVYANAKYVKGGAIFASGAEAYADKNSLYSPEFAEQVDACYAQMLEDGVLLEPISYTWDQETFTLTIVKHVSLLEAYIAALTFNPGEGTEYSLNNGWEYIPN